jgi:hypothetical protein
MKGRWWIGVTAGVAIGLGSVVGVEAATQPATAQGGTVSFAQFRQVQKVATAAVRRGNDSRKRLNKIGLQLPLWAVSSGAVGSNLLRGDGVVSSQRLTDGNYRVRFVRDVSACTWSATPASDGAALPAGFSIRVALDITEVSKTQLVVRTNDAAGQPVDSPFHVQVFC